MKPFTETEKNMSNMESNKNDKISRERIEKMKMASTYNHQERVEHVNKTVAQFDAMFARLKASKNGENK